MIKLSISNIGWGADHDNEMYQYLKDVGYQGLEIAPTRIFPNNPYDRLAEAKDWAEKLKTDYGLEISSMQSIWYGRQERIFGTKEERCLLIDYTKKAILFAEAVGCKNIVFGCPRNRDTDDVLGNYTIAIDFFREIGDYALEHDTIVAIEPNPVIYNTHFLNTTEQAVEMAYKSNSEGIKVNVDLGTIIYNEEDINYLKQIPEYINHVHISEPGLKTIEKRDLHSQTFSLLKKIDYDRYLSIEMGNTGNVRTVKIITKHVTSLQK